MFYVLIFFLSGSSNSSRLTQSHQLSSLNQSGLLSITEHTEKENESSESESETDEDEATPLGRSSSSSKPSARLPTTQQNDLSSHSAKKLAISLDGEAPVITSANEPGLPSATNPPTTIVSIPELQEKEVNRQTVVESELRSTASRPVAGSSDPLSFSSSSTMLQLLTSQPQNLTTKTRSSFIIKEEEEGEEEEEREKKVQQFPSLPLIQATESHKLQADSVSHDGSPIPLPERGGGETDTITASLPGAAGESVKVETPATPAEVEPSVRETETTTDHVLEMERHRKVTGQTTSQTEEKEEKKRRPSLPLTTSGSVNNDRLTSQPAEVEDTLTQTGTRTFVLGSNRHGEGVNLLPTAHPEKRGITGDRIVISLPQALTQSSQPEIVENSLSGSEDDIPVLTGETSMKGVKVLPDRSDASSEKLVEVEEREGERRRESDGRRLLEESGEKRVEEERERGRERLEEDSQWQEVMLEQLGEGLERELCELQQALEAAGLPGVTVEETRPPELSDEAGGPSATSAGELEPDADVHRQGIVFSVKDKTQQKSSAKIEAGDLGERVRGQRSVSPPFKQMTVPDEKLQEVGGGGEGEKELEETLRVLAKEELSSLARELLFQRDHEREREQGKRGGGARGRGLVAMGTGKHDRRENETRTGKSRLSRLVAPKTRPVVQKNSSKTSFDKSGSVSTGLTGGFKHSMKGSRTSLASSKLAQPVSGSGSQSGIGCGSGSRRGRGGGRGGGEGGGGGRGGGEGGGGGRGGGGGGGGGRGGGGGGGEKVKEVENLRNEVKSLKQALAEEQVRSHTLH